MRQQGHLKRTCKGISEEEIKYRTIMEHPYFSAMAANKCLFWLPAVSFFVRISKLFCTGTYNVIYYATEIPRSQQIKV